MQPNMGMGGGMPNMGASQMGGQQNNLGQSQLPQAPEKPKPLKVALTNKEKGYYSNLLTQADPNGENKIGG